MGGDVDPAIGLFLIIVLYGRVPHCQRKVAKVFVIQMPYKCATPQCCDAGASKAAMKYCSRFAPKWGVSPPSSNISVFAGI